MYRILALIVTLAAPTLAVAQDDAEREFDMEMSVRMRSMQIPDSIMDIWFYNESDPGWADGNNPRPDVTAFMPGFEFVVKGDGPNGIFYFDYAVATMSHGYWDDVEEPPNHNDGDYLEPADNLGMWALGADYAHELPFVRVENTDGKFGLSFLIGAGLGVAGIVGNNPKCDGAICRWGPEGSLGAHNRYVRGDPPDEVKRIPSILPMVDINAGLRFNFGNRVVMRVEGGLHDIIYFGGTLGIMF